MTPERKIQLRVIRDTLWEIAVFSWPRVRLLPILIPVAIAIGVGFLVNSEIIDPYLFQQRGEYAAVAILAVAFLISFLRFRSADDTYLRWLTWLIAILLVREIDPPGGTILAEIALPVMVILAASWYFRMGAYLANPTVLSLMVFVFATYYLTELLDGHWFDFIPREELWERGTEEVTELVGHIGVVLLALRSRPVDGRLAGSWQERFERAGLPAQAKDPEREVRTGTD